MNVTVIGTGFVGVVSAAVLASFGNHVIGLDVLPEKIEKLKQNIIPFFEPGLQELVMKGQQDGLLSFTTEYVEAIQHAEVVFIAVGTPSAPDGQADLKYVFAAADAMAPYIQPNTIVALKSTVPPGTCASVEKRIQAITSVPFACVSLPEFLREGSAVQDTIHPERVIIGATDPEVINKLSQLHQPLNAPILVMGPESAQMCKYTANSYLATRITFINQVANLCEVNGADIEEVIKGIGFDKRIGTHYWYPGPGYGGSCFPKDVKEMAAYARSVGEETNLLVKVSELNEERIGKLLEKYTQAVGSWQNKRVAVLGLSFKPNTDDIREAPSTKFIPLLLQMGAQVVAFDPMATPVFKASFPNLDVVYALSAKEAIQDADSIFLLTEWPQLISLRTEDLVSLPKPNAVIFDTRNVYAQRRQAFRESGIGYMGIGVR